MEGRSARHRYGALAGPVWPGASSAHLGRDGGAQPSCGPGPRIRRRATYDCRRAWVSPGIQANPIEVRKADMETEDDLIPGGSLFVSGGETTIGHILERTIPMAIGVINLGAAGGNLCSLGQDAIRERRSDREVSVFNNGGRALGPCGRALSSERATRRAVRAVSTLRVRKWSLPKKWRAQDAA